MADKTITALTATTSAAASDEIPILGSRVSRDAQDHEGEFPRRRHDRRRDAEQRAAIR